MTEDDHEHIVEAYEPVWQYRRLVANPDQSVTMIEHEVEGHVDGHEDAISYECSCGESFDDEAGALRHLKLNA